MKDISYRLSLRYRVLFYLGGIVFATTSYVLGLLAFGIESASWGYPDVYRQVVRSFVEHFVSHQPSLFAWELTCMGIAVAIGYLFDREVYYRRMAEERANLDGLTGIYNHRYFQERLSMEIERADRYGRPLSVIMLDIDDFKVFNDTWGHQEGDKLLVLFAALCARCIRSIDVLARYGGEEFVIILPETECKEALAVAERIRECTESETPTAFGKDRGVTMSAGVASFPLHDRTRHGLVLSADAALYYAKREGKNRSCIYEQTCHQTYRAKAPHVKPTGHHEEVLDAIGALGASVEARDSYSFGHSQSVMELATAFGKELRLTDDGLANLRVAALLHDIGKISTPRDVFCKTDPLDDREWKQIENHAGLGSRMLKRVQQMSSIGPGVKHHHERYDGQGYPSGLSGKNIPLIARIIAIADAYDAMTNPRSYRRAMPRNEALAEIKRCAGTQFDPDLVDAFIKSFERSGTQPGEAA